MHLARSGEAGGAPKPPEQPPSPEERMNRRFPQPVKVSFLVGLPMLDEGNSTLGRIESVQRTPEGKIRLVIGYGGLLGFGERPVAVPVELVAMLGDAVAAVDMPGRDFATAPTWQASEGQPLDPADTIRVAIIRRSLF